MQTLQPCAASHPHPPPPVPSRSLKEDAIALDQCAISLAVFCHEQALLELGGLRAERALTRKFRVPQTLGVLTAAERLVREVVVAARPAIDTGGGNPTLDTELGQLVAGIAEAEALLPAVGAGGQEGDDELDDAI